MCLCVCKLCLCICVCVYVWQYRTYYNYCLIINLTTAFSWLFLINITPLLSLVASFFKLLCHHLVLPNKWIDLQPATLMGQSNYGAKDRGAKDQRGKWPKEQKNEGQMTPNATNSYWSGSSSHHQSLWYGPYKEWLWSLHNNWTLTPFTWTLLI